MLVVSYLALECVSFWSVSDESGTLLFLPCSHQNAIAPIVHSPYHYSSYCFEGYFWRIFKQLTSENKSNKDLFLAKHGLK